MGLPLHQGAQLAIDITLRSTLTTTLEPCPGGATVNGAARQRSQIQRTVGRSLQFGSWVGVETGGRFGQEAVDFVDSLAAAKARDSPRILHRSAHLAWRRHLDADVSRLLCTLVRRFVGVGTHGQALTVVCQIWLICFTDFEWASRFLVLVFQWRVVLPSAFLSPSPLSPPPKKKNGPK